MLLRFLCRSFVGFSYPLPELSFYMPVGDGKPSASASSLDGIHPCPFSPLWNDGLLIPLFYARHRNLLLLMGWNAARRVHIDGDGFGLWSVLQTKGTLRDGDDWLPYISAAKAGTILTTGPTDGPPKNVPDRLVRSGIAFANVEHMIVGVFLKGIVFLHGSLFL